MLSQGPIDSTASLLLDYNTRPERKDVRILAIPMIKLENVEAMVINAFIYFSFSVAHSI